MTAALEERNLEPLRTIKTPEKAAELLQWGDNVANYIKRRRSIQSQ